MVDLKQRVLELSDKIKNENLSEEIVQHEVVKMLGIDPNVDKKNTNRLILDLLCVSEEKRKLPISITAKNGMFFYPEIKMYFENGGSPLLGDNLERMVLDWY